MGKGRSIFTSVWPGVSCAFLALCHRAGLDRQGGQREERKITARPGQDRPAHTLPPPETPLPRGDWRVALGFPPSASVSTRQGARNTL